MRQLLNWFNELGIPPAAVVGTLIIPAAAMLAHAILNRTVRRVAHGMPPRFHLHPNAETVAARVIGAILWVCACLLLINAWGGSVGGLWSVMLSVLTAVGVGFLAVWTMISNVTASLFITIWRPFHFGETVEILPEGMSGRVTNRNLMFTTLRDLDGTVLHVPNNLFFQKMFRVSEGGAARETAALAAKARS